MNLYKDYLNEINERKKAKFATQALLMTGILLKSSF